ncbi:hypothetical protein GCM10022240_09200 [Microbacterium kribbense]|uniref:ABC-2 type transport system permease protein n=1 Tax=Microbacterium kribbense TaxID=433645 RepID=A0ABP7G8D8_9MICO
MVATVLTLRYRILANTLTRNVWQLVGFVLGMFWAACALVAVLVGFIALAIWEGAPEARLVAVAGGSLLVLGWVIGPVLIAGSDMTVDAGRLAPFPLSRRQTMLALAGIGLTGVPGIATSAAALSTIVLWARWPVAAVVGLVGAVLGVLTCVLAGRLATTWSAGLGSKRRGREIVGTVLLALLVLTGPTITGVATLLDAAGGVGDRVAGVVAVLGWTPLGAAWAAPADLAAPSGAGWLPAMARLAIAAASVIVLWLAWSRALDGVTDSPARRTARSARARSLGWFGRVPTGDVGATWARALTAWLRDPRYLRQLLFVPLLPIVFLVGQGVDGPLFASSAVAVALLQGIAGYSDVSYDGTAFGTVLATGIRGSHDRLGRLLGAACIGVPAVLAVGAVTLAIAGDAHRAPAVFGAALALLLSGYAVSAVASALLVVPVPAPGDSPFRRVPGQTMASGLLVFVVMAAMLVLAAPALVLALIGALADLTLVSWLSLAVAVVVGVAAIAVGVVVGGRLLDRTGPDLLQRIKAFPTR